MTAGRPRDSNSSFRMKKKAMARSLTLPANDFLPVLERKHLPELRREVNIRQAVCLGEERGDFLIAESGGSATDAGCQECHRRMMVGKTDELLNFPGHDLQWMFLFHRKIRHRDGISSALKSFTLSEDGTEVTKDII